MFGFNIGLKIALLLSSLKAGPVLSPTEKALMKDNIQLIISDLPLHSMNIFIELFKARPDYQMLFKNFRDVPFVELRNDTALQGHSGKIVATLVGVVTDYSHDSHALFTKFVDVAEHHIPRRVNHLNILTLKKVLLKYLANALSGSMPEQDLQNLLNAWEKIFKIAYDAFKVVN